MKRFFLGFLGGLLFCGLAVVLVVVAALRMGDAAPSVSATTTLVLHLEGDLPEQAPLELPIPGLQGSPPMTMLDTWKVLHKAALDSRIKQLVLEPRGLSAGWAKLEELRAGIEAFKKSGKPVYAYLRGPSAHDYYVAASADKIYMAPADLLDVKGLRAELMYFKGTLDKLGVQMEFQHVGKYKDAPDQYTRESARPETIEVFNQILDQYFGNLVDVIAQGRKMKPEAVRAAIDEGPFTGGNALKLGLVDKLIFEDEITPDFRTTKKLSGEEYAKVSVSDFEGGTKIAFITAQGEITRGSSGGVTDDGITASGLVRVLRQVEEDDDIKAAILRVDSPGGDGIASDDILHEMKILSAKKPLVISMSDTAASGGYFIAMSGDPVVAYSNTITGSIGVFYGRVNLKGLFDKIGLKEEIFSRGKFSRIDSPYGPLSDDERAKLQQEIEIFYKSFVERVATSRKRPYEQVEPLAQGRAWLGSQAKQNGLIDELGGLDRVVELVKQRAKLGASDKVTLVSFPAKRSLFQVLLNRDADAQAEALVERKIRALIGVRLPWHALAQGGVMQLMPYSLTVR